MEERTLECFKKKKKSVPLEQGHYTSILNKGQNCLKWLLKTSVFLRLLLGYVIFICPTGTKHGLESQLEREEHIFHYLRSLRIHQVLIRRLDVDTLGTKHN